MRHTQGIYIRWLIILLADRNIQPWAAAQPFNGQGHPIQITRRKIKLFTTPTTCKCGRGIGGLKSETMKIQENDEENGIVPPSEYKRPGRLREWINDTFGIIA